jgi:hypothetical protein
MTRNFATHQAYWYYIRWRHQVDVSCTVSVLKKNRYYHLQGTNVKQLSSTVPVQVMPNFMHQEITRLGDEWHCSPQTIKCFHLPQLRHLVPLKLHENSCEQYVKHNYTLLKWAIFWDHKKWRTFVKNVAKEWWTEVSLYSLFLLLEQHNIWGELHWPPLHRFIRGVTWHASTDLILCCKLSKILH